MPAAPTTLPTLEQLRRALPLLERIENLQTELRAVFEEPSSPAASPSLTTLRARGVKKKRNMSTAGREKIAAAARARWARVKAEGAGGGAADAGAPVPGTKRKKLATAPTRKKKDPVEQPSAEG